MQYIRPSYWLQKNSLKQVARYIIVGGSGAAAQFLTVTLAVEYHLTTAVHANFLGYLFGFIIAFTGHRHWTFAATERHTAVILPHYLLITGINFVLNQSLFYYFFKILVLHYQLALFFDLAIVTIITFLLNKIWVFRV